MNEKPSQNIKTEQKPAEKKPNEHGGFYFSSYLKIFDPNTKQVLVAKRGDS
jgi:hypothetical protein